MIKDKGHDLKEEWLSTSSWGPSYPIETETASTLSTWDNSILFCVNYAPGIVSHSSPRMRTQEVLTESSL